MCGKEIIPAGASENILSWDLSAKNFIQYVVDREGLVSGVLLNDCSLPACEKLPPDCCHLKAHLPVVQVVAEGVSQCQPRTSF